MAKDDIVIEEDITTITVDKAKEWVKKSLSTARPGRVIRCPCCAQRVRLQSRLISASQAALLVLLYRSFQIGTVVSINKFVDALPFENAKQFFKSREWHRLRHWGLLEELNELDTSQARQTYRMLYPEDEEDKVVTFHRLTQLGYDYAMGEKAIPRRLLMFRNNVIGTDENDLATIGEAFKRGSFKMGSLTGTVRPAGKIF